MTVPFRRRQDDGVGQGPVESIERKPDEDKEYDVLDALADDFMKAIETKDKAFLKEAIAALCNYIMDIDSEQDLEMEGQG